MADTSVESTAGTSDQQSIADAEPAGHPLSPKDKSSRIYRACIHCRQRKSKCQLDAGSRPGVPPCRRCVREGRECILAGSRRGGRRPKKTLSLDSIQVPTATPSGHNGLNGYIQEPPQSTGGTLPDSGWDESWEANKDRRMSIPRFTSGAQGESVDSTIDKADIQNPSDALEILAQVAGGEHSNPGSVPPRSVPHNHEHGENRPHGLFSGFPPFVSGSISYQDILSLFDRYHQKFHPFFPIVPERCFEPTNLSHMSSEEPHLFAAILTIAAADTNTAVYQACSIHVRGLIAELVYGGDGDVEAVEALLVLSEWATIWQPATARIAKVHEDRYAWMLVGMAVRLGVYLGLEQTSFRSSDAKELSPQHARRRLTWAACYMADRQVSIRVGKGFWSRGPGPTSFFETRDFPSLERKRPEDPDYASIFKANLELIHIFSNAHDVLYSNRGHGMKMLLSGGTYVKYIDDFRTAIRGWHSRYMHQNFDYPPNIRSTLLLLHDYLRLYVNAFAFQTSFSRFTSLDRDRKSVASLPDARFIYEAVDAAKSLLVTVNKFVDPQNCLRFLPLRYYTYIVYSSVFLYKALATMSKEERELVRGMVNDTVMCLTKSSTDSTHLGTRYAKLISLLWRRPPKQANKPAADQNMDTPEEIDYMYPANQKPLEGDLSLNAFSWLDLSAVGDFATRNNNLSHGYSEFDFADMNQSYLDGFAENQQWYDNSSPSFIF